MIIKKSTLERTAVYFIYIFWIILIVFDYKRYHIWSQILDIGFSDGVILELYNTNHPHLLRYALVYPILYLSDCLNINLNLLYSFVFFILSLIVFSLLKKISNDILQKNKIHVLLLLLIFIVSLFMNGRIIFGFLGATILTYTFYFNLLGYYSNIKFFFNIILSLFCMSITTGVFMVGVLSIIIYIFFISHKNYFVTKKFFNVKILCILIVILLSTPLIQQYLMKNLDYYNGSLILMLSHGIGKVFYNKVVLICFVIILPITIVACIKMYVKIIKSKYYVSLVPIIISSFIIGLFGHSSLTICLPIVFVIVCIYIDRIRIK